MPDLDMKDTQEMLDALLSVKYVGNVKKGHFSAVSRRKLPHATSYTKSSTNVIAEEENGFFIGSVLNCTSGEAV